jgi:hypothetical protein
LGLVLQPRLSKRSLGYEGLGSQLYSGCPSCWPCHLVRQNLCLGTVMRIKIAIGIVVVWWLLQVALVVVRGL